MNWDNLKFRRIFSKSMYKNLKLPLAEMTFTKDFVNDKRGDLYPIIEKDSACAELKASCAFRTVIVSCRPYGV